MKNLALSSVLCLLSFVLWLVSLPGCDQNPLLKRTGADYFPLEQGNSWAYLRSKKTEKDTVTLKVITATSIYARECWLLERNALPEYWWKDNRRLDRLYCETIFVNGEEDTIGTFWIPWLHLPFVLNDQWTTTLNAQKIILGDTVHVCIQIDSKVVDLKSNDYKVEITLIKSMQSKTFGSYCDTIIYYEWYSQDIGITERTFNNTREELISYSLK